LQVVSSLQVFQPKYWMHCSIHPCYMQYQSHPPWYNNHNDVLWIVPFMKALFFAVLSTLPPLSSYWSECILSTQFSSTSIDVLRLVWATEFHNHTERQVKLWFLFIQILIFWRGDGKRKWTKLYQALCAFNLLLIFLRMQFLLPSSIHWRLLYYQSLNFDFVICL